MIEFPRALRITVSDLDLGQWWYTQAFGVAPNEVRADGVQFQVQGFAVLLTLGTPAGDAGPVVYWGVADVAGEHARLLALQDDSTQALQALRQDTQEAVLRDPFGNAFGLTRWGEEHIRAARSQRSAEKIALRHVRDTLDGLQQEERDKHSASRLLRHAGLVLMTVAVIVAAIFATAKLIKSPKSAEQSLDMPTLRRP